MIDYAYWTTLRLLHFWYHQPMWCDRYGVKAELERRGVAVTEPPNA